MTQYVDFIRDHARKNVWCAPGQDSQFTFTLPRISSPSGAIATIRAGDYVVDLPSKDYRYQVFQIGGIPPRVFKLLYRSYYWVSADEHAAEQFCTVRLHNNFGVVASLSDVFYRYTEEGNLLVAVRMHSLTGIEWLTDKIYLSLYSNIYWQTAEGNNDPVGFEVGAALLETPDIIADFLAKYNTAASKAASPIQLQFWHNGLRKDFSEVTMAIGDSVFFELDGSIKRRYTFPIGQTQVFDSALDRARKYLLHPPKESESVGIDYFDDVEFFVTSTNALGKPALHYPVLSQPDVRQLTHRDYAVVVSNVVYQGTYLTSVGGGLYNTFSIQAVVRKNGANRQLVQEAAFIQELYKLDEEDILRAMHGIDATVPFWRAAELEASYYPEVMRAQDYKDLTYPNIEKAYGYYALAKAMADTPSVVQNPGNSGFVFVPYLLMFGGTAYEYDANGLFIGWHHHYSGDRYYVKDEACATVEFLAGFGGPILDEVHGARQVGLQTNRNYRVYLRQSVGGQIQKGFTDVTGSDKYTINNGIFTWTSTTATDYPTIRSDKRFFCADYSVRNDESTLSVSLISQQRHLENILNLPIGVDLGQMDVFLNGFSLTRGLHYYYKDSQVVITTKRFLNTETPEQQVHVRFYGFCRPTGQLYPEGDYGFIEHGLLSNNRVFDVRDGRVSRVVVEGRLRSVEDLQFGEGDALAAPTDALNGNSYMIKDIYVPLVPFAPGDTWQLVEEARGRVKKVSDYLTLKKPELDRGPVVGVANKLDVISPFLARILFDILYSRLSIPPKESFTRQEIIEICKSYEPLLETDPIKQEIDLRYVVIDLHAGLTPLAVSPRQWSFINQVIKLYADGMVAINDSLVISQ